MMHTPDDPERAEARTTLRGISQQLLPLHRALIDDASAQFLHFLARQAASQPLLLLCEYLDEALQTDEQLAVLVASLSR